jgi:hypothetical protein
VIFDSILNRAPVPPVRLNPDVPAELERIIDKCLEKDRNLRYQHASEIRTDLQRLKRNATRDITASAGPTTTTGRAKRWKAISASGSRSVLLYAAVAIIILAAGLAWHDGSPKGPVTVPSEYVQLTNFSDYATAPALSRDGRMVAFFRGGGTFLGTGQVYVKLLPNGESKQWAVPCPLVFRWKAIVDSRRP